MAIWTPSAGDFPKPPRNPMVFSPYTRGAWDLHWDDPSIRAANSVWTITGVNIYRSHVSDRGPFHRINPFPVSGSFYRDQTDVVPVERELIVFERDWVTRGDSPSGRWRFRTEHTIYKRLQFSPNAHPVIANAPRDVAVTIDGEVVAVDAVFGRDGEVTLVNRSTYDSATERVTPVLLPTPDSVVEVTYWTVKDFVPSGLAVNIYYRFTAVALDPNDAFALRETPLEFSEPITTASVENMDWIWREAVRRNNWILEQGGERVKVFIRRQHGIFCDCCRDARTLEFTKQAAADCEVCFPPGTLVRTEQGYRPIEQIRVGERVLSSDGLYRRVTQTFRSVFDGKLVSVRPSVSTRPILTTPEHPFRVLRGAHGPEHGCGPKCNSFIKRGDGFKSRRDVRELPSGRWHARAQSGGSRGVGRVVLGTFSTKQGGNLAVDLFREERVLPGHVLEWEDAANIRDRDWLVAKWPAATTDLAQVIVPRAFRKNTHRGMRRLGPNEFQVDVDFLWVVGLYLAEGCPGTRSISFCLHVEEVEYQDRLLRFFRRHGYHPKVVSGNGKGVRVQVYSTTLAGWFPEWLGSGCANKKIPEQLMSLPAGKTWALIRGVHDGDGSNRDHEITQTSEILALQLAELLHRVGEQPLIRQQKANTLTPKGNRRKLAYCVSWAEDTLGRDNRKGRWAFQDEVLAQVRSVDGVPYTGFVYNLAVEGDHTYVVNGVVVHNCFGTRFVGGYEGPYDFTIAPDDAEKRITQGMRGRRVEHAYEVWTGPTPLVTQRDFIVKQTNERYSIGGVRRPSERGMMLQQHFNIGYFDEADIRYRVPIDGVSELPWPETRYGIRPVKSEDQIGHIEAPWPITPDSPKGYMPQGTEKSNIPDEREQRGRTPVYDSTTY